MRQCVSKEYVIVLVGGIQKPVEYNEGDDDRSDATDGDSP
jgi:hypothetical protein